MEPGTGYLVMASHLPLKRITATVRFFRGVSAVRKQLATADGLIGYTLRARPLARDYWTLSAQPMAVPAWLAPLNTWPPDSVCLWPIQAGHPRQERSVSRQTMAPDQRTRTASSARNTCRVQRSRWAYLSADLARGAGTY
jgi:hypothetical protein